MADFPRVMPGIRAAFASALGADPRSIDIDVSPDDVEGWDSLGHVELVSALEAAFGVQFDIGELMELEDVRSIAVVLDEKVGAAHRAAA